MKKGFSLLELIIVIVVMAIIASFAIPKYMNTRDSAMATTIKGDLMTTITSIQSYYLVNRKIDKISDAVILNESNWEITNKKLIYRDDSSICLVLELNENDINISLTKSAGNVCKLLEKMGIKSQKIDLL